MYARASDNMEWVIKMLADPDERVRANAVEGLWETKATSAGEVFREAALDPDPGVQINGLLGLHYIGDPNVDLRAALEKMSGAPNPTARAAAAFAMGRIRDMIYLPALEVLLKDEEGPVRRQALRALISIRRHNRGDSTLSLPAGPLLHAELAGTNEISPAEPPKNLPG